MQQSCPQALADGSISDVIGQSEFLPAFGFLEPYGRDLTNSAT